MYIFWMNDWMNEHWKSFNVPQTQIYGTLLFVYILAYLTLLLLQYLFTSLYCRCIIIIIITWVNMLYFSKTVWFVYLLCYPFEGFRLWCQVFYRTEWLLFFNVTYAEERTRRQCCVTSSCASLDTASCSKGTWASPPLILYPASFLYLYWLFSNRTTAGTSGYLSWSFLLSFAPSDITHFLSFFLFLLLLLYVLLSCVKNYLWIFPFLSFRKEQ